MSTSTNIEWTDATWNPTEGCSMAKGSENGGCLNCYAARTALRRPASGLAVMRDSGPRWTGKVQLVENRLDAPLHWRASKRIFVNSMSDLFHESLPDEAIDRVFAVMALCPQHTFQVLTKRPERMLKYLMHSHRVAFLSLAMAQATMDTGYFASLVSFSWPFFNVWLGVSVENQTTADARIPLLLRTPAAMRFVSYEPALGPVDFGAWFRPIICDACWGVGTAQHTCGSSGPSPDWVIVGGESGPGARPFDLAWARNTIAQCKAAGVACFMKQLGAKPRNINIVRLDNNCGRIGCTCCWLPIKLTNKKGGDMSEWPEDLRVRQFPEAV